MTVRRRAMRDCRSGGGGVARSVRPGEGSRRRAFALAGGTCIPADGGPSRPRAANARRRVARTGLVAFVSGGVARSVRPGEGSRRRAFATAVGTCIPVDGVRLRPRAANARRRVARMGRDGVQRSGVGAAPLCGPGE